MLAVLTGPVRSGKSQRAVTLALGSGRPVVVAVGGSADDAEMARRIAKHQAERPEEMTVIETARDPGWKEHVAPEACLLIDCLGSVLGAELVGLAEGDASLADATAEERADAIAASLVEWITARKAPTVVVTNEVGWGVVPASALGRLFRDVMGRANRALVDAADAAWLVVAGRAMPLHTRIQEVSWPTTE